MDQIATSLQKSIQDNFRTLNLMGMASTPQVMCSCSLFKNALDPSSNTAKPASPTVTPEIIPSQFVPGEQRTVAANAEFLPVDTGNIPFILPKGVTPDDILMEQEAALKPLIAAAEEEAKAKAEATGTSTVVTTTAPAGTAVAVATEGGLTPTTTVVAGTPTTVSVTPAIEQYAAFRYDDLYDNVPSYRQSLLMNDDSQYMRGARDMYTVSLSSWIVYIILVAVIYWYFWGNVRVR